MMASDEGMNPELFSDGRNKNFSVLAQLTDILDAGLLEDEISAILRRVQPGRYTMAGAELQAEGHVTDLHSLVGGDIDFLGIDSEVNELIHGAAPELSEEELADILSEQEGFQDEFDAAINEIVGE